ncbi:acyl-CoA dehydrogenase family protein [Halobacillus locisalis]|uniref:Acyl-CoA dehydrogenase family protein n=1 Tax=Halobacillus locisalis TaxID=220753 RepID=A0A838CWV0_9BACI|nr:acyl-CoA dehydrogenase family protein [Halobacillus locisalis]MBA2176408.1 acyl-CoA dehydrogenase family protein [Halobacillus locisalis]
MSSVKHFVQGGDFLIEEITAESVFTPEDCTDEHRMIAGTARQFISREIHPYMKRLEEGDFPFVAEKMKKAGELGLLGHSVPEKYGGLGLDKMSKGIVGEALGNASGYSVAHSNHTCIATLPITYFGTKQQKEKYLPKLASGEYLGAYCLTEPEAGSDALAAQTTAVLNESETHYILNGTKIYITNASFADTFIVYAKVDSRHFTAFIVEKDFPGLSIGPEESKMGIKGSSTCSVSMEDCEVPIENVIGEIGKGHLIALNVLNLGRFNLGFATLGAAKYSFQLALEHSTERKQFKKSISEFGATKEKVAQMAARLYATESLLYRTAGHVESALGEHEDSSDFKAVAKAMNEHALESAICKIVGSETLDYVVDEALQLHGGAGFIKEYPVEMAYRDSRINRIFEGTNEINRLLIPGAFFKKVAKDFLDTRTIVERAQHSLHNGVFKKQTGELSELKQALALFKDLHLVCAGLAFFKYGTSVKNEQETLMKLADLAIAIYSTESVILRTEKASERNHKQKLAYTYVEQTALEVQHAVIPMLSELLVGEERTKTLGQVSLLLAAYHWPDSVERKRKIADFYSEQKRYQS